MQNDDEPRAGADGAPLTIVLPLLPGQSEPWRRFLQELQGARRSGFDAACWRWGIRALTLWLAPARTGDVVVAQVVMATNLSDVAERFVPSRQPFDRWIAERARELHGVDVSLGLARHRAELLAGWQAESPLSTGGLPASPAG